jgi:hypothetical protein
MSSEHKVAVITGASQGISASLVRLLPIKMSQSTGRKAHPHGNKKPLPFSPTIP